MAISDLGGALHEHEASLCESYEVETQSSSSRTFYAAKDQERLPSGQDVAGQSHKSPLQALGSLNSGLPGPLMPRPRPQ